MKVYSYELNIGVNAWRILRKELNKLGINIEEEAKDMNSFDIKVRINNYERYAEDISKEDFDPRGGVKDNYEFYLTKMLVDQKVERGKL